MRLRLPALPEPFPPAFRQLLQRILHSGDRLKGARVEAARARRMQLSQSGVFTGHRPYLPGDDLRLIDWNAYARSGGLFLKQLEEEERRAVALVFDTAPRMYAGTPPRWTGALQLAAILGGLALRHVESVRLVSAHGDQELAGRGGIEALLEQLAALPPRAQPPLQLASELLRRGLVGKVLWVSDFADPAAFAPALQLLRRRGCRTAGWLPAIADDSAAPQRGWLRVVDPDSGRDLAIAVDHELAQQLQQELRLLQRRQQRVFAECGAALQRFALPAPGDFSMAAWVGAAWSFRR